MPPSHPSKYATNRSGTWGGRQPGLDAKSFNQYFARFYRRELEGTYFNGQLVADKTDKRIIHRWRKEQSVVGFFRASDFLMDYGLTIDDFFAYCRDNDLPVWYAQDEKLVKKYTLKYGG